MKSKPSNPLANPAPPSNPLCGKATAMANSSTIDHLSNLPDALLITIISLLSTPTAARTSVLCRRFRHLWEASPSLSLISNSDDLPWPRSQNFISMVNRALLGRNPSYHLLSLRLEVSRSSSQNAIAIISSFLAKTRSLNLRHLTMEGFHLSDLLPILPIVFTINSLKCLSLYLRSTTLSHLELNFPSGINLTSLRSLSLKLLRTHLTNFNELLSELCSLEDLNLFINHTPGLSVSSKSIKKLRLVTIAISRELEPAIVDLSLPSLESLHLEIYDGIEKLSHFHGEVPLLRKALIKLHKLHESSVKVIAALLNCISHVEELSLHLTERKDEKYPIPILLQSIKDVPEFPKFEHLDLTLCFHEHNLEAVNIMLHKCPALKSLKLVHEVPNFTGLSRGRKRKDWKSRLPRNADGNYRYAYFKNLHLEENRKEVIKLLSKKCSSIRSIKDTLVEETCAIRGSKGKSIATAPNRSILRTLREVSSSDDDNAMTQQQIDDFSKPEFHVIADSVEVVHEPLFESVNPSPNVPISEPVNPMSNVPVYEPIRVPSSQNSKRANKSGDQSSRCTKQKQNVNRMDEFAERFLCQQQQRTELIAQLGQRTELIAQLGQANSVHDQVLNKLQSLALPPAIHVDMQISLANSWIRSCFMKEDNNERLMIFVDRVVELFRSGQLPLNS